MSVTTKYDYTTRTVTVWDNGTQVESRAFTAAENAQADAAAIEMAAIVNEATISSNLASDLIALQAIIDQTNADINASPASEIKDLARVARRLIRKVEQILDGTD
jgi:hypothetical protein